MSRLCGMIHPFRDLFLPNPASDEKHCDEYSCSRLGKGGPFRIWFQKRTYKLGNKNVLGTSQLESK